MTCTRDHACSLLVVIYVLPIMSLIKKLGAGALTWVWAFAHIMCKQNRQQ